MSERNDNNKPTGRTDGVSFFGATDDGAGSSDSLGTSGDNRSGDGLGSGDNRSEGGSGRSDDGSGTGSNGAGNGLPKSSAGTVGEDRSNSGNDSVKSGDSGNRGRGRPATRNGVSGQRRTGSGDEGSGNGGQTQAKIVVAPAEGDVKAPKVGGFDKFSPSQAKFKKGYRPLMDEKESIQTVGGMFAMTSLALGEHWNLTDNEEKELGKAVSRVLEKFPVKVGENPELLEKIFAIQGLVVTASLVIIPRMQATAKGKNDGIFQQIAGRRKTANGNEQAESNRNAAPNNGAGEIQSLDEFADAFRPE